MTDIATLKARVDFRALVAETHHVNAASKVLCPFHDDHTPSCHIYRDGFKCYGCGVYGDHLDWLERTRNLSAAQAVRALEAWSGVPPRRTAGRHTSSRAPIFTPLTEQELRTYHQRLHRTWRLPKALAGRGLTLADARVLGIAALNEDALLPIAGPNGALLALKRRFFHPPGGQRYCYTTAGHGSPAWCSPDLREAATVLVIEGELNGMISWLALREAGVLAAVMAAAGAQAGLHESALRNREVFIYADADAAGAKARRRWRARARRAGAKAVTVLRPFEADACELASRCGRHHLAARLLEAMGPLQPRLPLPDSPKDLKVAWTRR